MSFLRILIADDQALVRAGKTSEGYVLATTLPLEHT